MTGAHRLRRSPAQRISSFLSGLAAIWPIPALGLGIYLLVVGTPLQDWVALLAISTGLLIFQIVRRHRDAGMIWLMAGVVLSASWQVTSAFAHLRGWSARELAVVANTGDWVRWALMVCLSVSIVVGIRSGTLTWPPWRLSDRGPADPS